MKFNKRRIFLTILLFAGIFAATSCGKDDITELSYEYLSGSVSYSLPDYVEAGEDFTVVPGGVYRSDGGDFGYYWIMSTSSAVRDTTKWEGDGPSATGAYSFTTPDDLTSFSLSVTAFAYNHVGSTYSRTVTVVDPSMDGSLTDRDFGSDTKTFVDSRDGTEYHYRKIGSLEWMQQNLAYEGAGVPLRDCEVMNYPYGRYYTWDEAQDVCPEGWHLPSGEEWDDLVATVGDGSYKGIAGNLMVNAKFNGERMWAYWPAVSITNSVYFNAIPTGYGLVDENKSGTFSGNLEYASFWTSDVFNEEQGVFRYLFVSSPDVMMGTGHKNSFSASVRCVRDSE